MLDQFVTKQTSNVRTEQNRTEQIHFLIENITWPGSPGMVRKPGKWDKKGD
jgi:hypothetical protein